MGDFISGFRNSREIGSVRNVCMKSMPAGTHTVEEEKKERKKVIRTVKIKKKEKK